MSLTPEEVANLYYNAVVNEIGHSRADEDIQDSLLHNLKLVHKEILKEIASSDK